MAEVRLSDFLGELSRRPFDWATCNCLLICADWVVRATGRDPAAKWRGCFADKASALRLLRDEGGACALATKAMAAIAAPPVERPQAGDVALVWTPVGKKSGRIIRRPVGAICVDGKSFAVLTIDLGLVIAPLQLVRAWSISWPSPSAN